MADISANKIELDKYQFQLFTDEYSIYNFEFSLMDGNGDTFSAKFTNIDPKYACVIKCSESVCSER